MSREQQVRDAIERFLSHVRQHTDTHLAALSTDLLGIVKGDGAAGADLEGAAIEVARAVAKGGSYARHDLISRVVIAMRRLDDAMTLRAIFDALVDGAAEEASRVAVLLVDKTTLRGYRHHGFPPGAAPIELPVDASPLLSSAVTLGQVTPVGAAGNPPDPQIPAFMRVAPNHVGLLMPLIVSNAVVALVYAEGPDRSVTEPGTAVWTSLAEVLVRHGSARLENVTSKRTVEVLTGHS